MSYDLAIWKWKTAETANSPHAVAKSILKGKPHEAITRFDIPEFTAACRAEFGSDGDADDDEWPFEYEPSDFKRASANWIRINAGWVDLALTLSKLLKLCAARGLAVYDFQESRLLPASME